MTRELRRPPAFTRQTPPTPTGVYVQPAGTCERVPADLVYAGKRPVPGHKARFDVWQTRELFRWDRVNPPKLVITGTVPALTRIELRISQP